VTGSDGFQSLFLGSLVIVSFFAGLGILFIVGLLLLVHLVGIRSRTIFFENNFEICYSPPKMVGT